MSATPTAGSEANASGVDPSKLRSGPHHQSRGACWVCGLRETASVHLADASGSMAWWQHPYDPAILTRVARPGLG